MLLDEWFDRAVEIVVPGRAGAPGSRESGFMVVPGVVLTALHVVVGLQSVLAVPDGRPAGTDCAQGDVALVVVPQQQRTGNGIDAMLFQRSIIAPT
jgi:hypothetical protein